MKKLVIALLFVALLGVGYFRWQASQPKDPLSPPGGHAAATAQTGAAASGSPGASAGVAKEPAKGLVATLQEPAAIMSAATYVPKDGVVDVELSQYAGYAGLIYAAFATPLQVSVADTYGNAVSDGSVTFAGPASGASAVFTTNPAS